MKGGPNLSRVNSGGEGTTQDDFPARTSAAVHSFF